MTRKKKSMGLGLLSIAWPFFFNPNISIIDILPDFIGYALLYFALYQLADLNESIAGAASIFQKMIFIDAGKWLALFWVFGISVPNEQSSSLLLWSFVFAVAEMICLIPAYGKLFAGMTQLGYFYPNTAIFVDAMNRRKNPTDRMRNLTVLFVCVKAILSFLPELADLSNSSYDEVDGMVDLYQYIGVIRMLAFIPILIVGLIWVIKIERYFKKIRKDRLLIEALSGRYETEILPKKGMFSCRHFRWIGGIFVVALCLTVDFRLENRNMIPDFLAALFVGLTFFLIYKYFRCKKTIWIPLCVAYAVSTVACFQLENQFFDRFYYGALLRSEEASNLYGILVAANVIQALIFIGLMWLMVCSLFALVREHTGYVSGREQSGSTEQKMIQAVHAELRRSVLLGFCLAVSYAIFDVVYLLLIPNFGFVNIIHLVFAILCIGSFARATAQIQQAMDTKYMLE